MIIQIKCKRCDSSFTYTKVDGNIVYEKCGYVHNPIKDKANKLNGGKA
jgi:uncharacterized C2H2 Zn-finger protein